MGARQIVVRDIKRDGGTVRFKTLAKAVAEPRKTLTRLAQRQVRPLNV